MKKIVVTAVLAVVLLPLILSACDNIQVGYAGNNIGNHINGSYQLFSGTKTKNIGAKAGDTIEFQYSSKVEDGNLTMKILDANGTVQEILTANTTGTADLQAPDDETYQLVIKGSHTKGNFNVSWDIN